MNNRRYPGPPGVDRPILEAPWRTNASIFHNTSRPPYQTTTSVYEREQTTFRFLDMAMELRFFVYEHLNNKDHYRLRFRIADSTTAITLVSQKPLTPIYNTSKFFLAEAKPEFAKIFARSTVDRNTPRIIIDAGDTNLLAGRGGILDYLMMKINGGMDKRSASTPVEWGAAGRRATFNQSEMVTAMREHPIAFAETLLNHDTACEAFASKAAKHLHCANGAHWQESWGAEAQDALENLPPGTFDPYDRVARAIETEAIITQLVTAPGGRSRGLHLVVRCGEEEGFDMEEFLILLACRGREWNIRVFVYTLGAQETIFDFRDLWVRFEGQVEEGVWRNEWL